MPMKLYAHPDDYKTKKALISAKYVGLEIESPGGAAGAAQAGKIPVLETDGGCIFSSVAIARYISRISRPVGLYGQNILEGGMIDSWIEFCTHELEVPLQTWVLPKMGAFPEQPDITAIAKEDVKKALTVLNNHLLHNTFMVGNSVTLADISVCCALLDGMKLVLDSAFRKPFANLQRWFDLCISQPEFTQVLGKVTVLGGAPKSPKGPAAGAAPKKAASPKASPKAAPKKAASPKAAPAAAPAAGGAVDEAAVKAVGDQIRELKEKLKAEGLSGKKVNDHEAVKALVANLAALKSGAAAAPAAKAASPKAKAASPKAAPKKEAAKKDKKDDAKPAEDPAKLLKKVIKEGGKRGVEIEGAADMGGLGFFCTSVDEPQGDLDLLVKSVEAMNEKSDPTEEERKGGSGRIGKMVFSAGVHQLAVVAYVPEDKRKELDCTKWLEKVLSLFGGKVTKGAADVSTGIVKTDGDKGIFPLKIREAMILEANNFLRKLGLFPEDKDDDSDEMVFGDDDFPS